MRLLLALFCALFLAAPASAASVENVRSLDLLLSGTIGQRCSMGSIGNMDFGDIARPGLGAAARVALDCNMPFRVTVQAANGGLAHDQMPLGQGGYRGTLPYSLSLEVPVRRPQPAVVAQRFDSRQLVGGGSLSSNGGIASDGMVLAVELAPPPSEGLLAGNYGETITITVAPE